MHHYHHRPLFDVVVVELDEAGNTLHQRWPVVAWLTDGRIPDAVVLTDQHRLMRASHAEESGASNVRFIPSDASAADVARLVDEAASGLRSVRRARA